MHKRVGAVALLFAACATAERDRPSPDPPDVTIALFSERDCGGLQSVRIDRTPARNAICQDPPPGSVRPGDKVRLSIEAPYDGPGSIRSVEWTIDACRLGDDYVWRSGRLLHWAHPIGGRVNSVFRFKIDAPSVCRILLSVSEEGPPYVVAKPVDIYVEATHRYAAPLR